MKVYEATEQAYKNGYENGYKDGKADAVVHGRWLEDTYCSNCHWFAEDEEGHIVQSFHNYCPNCGAKNV